MVVNPWHSVGQPRILKEKILASRGKWVYKARITIYHNKERRVELVFEEDKNLSHLFDPGLTLEELDQLYSLLKQFAIENYE
jgi:hypothetical protein